MAKLPPGGPTLHLRRGAGAYICGEESALLESIENPGQHLRINTDTGVGDRYLYNLLFFVSD